MERQHYQQNHINGHSTQSYGQQLLEIHANALPGVTRPEEGEESYSQDDDLERGGMAQEAAHRNYNHYEHSRERERYEDYLDEQDSEKLPNAFDLGWRRNLQHLFGPKPLLWFLPICNTTGDGWHWEPSPKWLEAREDIRRQREAQWRAQEQRELDAGWGVPSLPPPSPRDQRVEYQDREYKGQRAQPRSDSYRQYLTTSAGVASVPASGRRSPGKADQILGRQTQQFIDGNYFGNRRPSSGVSMETLIPSRNEYGEEEDEDNDHYEVSSDEEASVHRAEAGDGDAPPAKSQSRAEDEWREWE